LQSKINLGGSRTVQLLFWNCALIYADKADLSEMKVKFMLKYAWEWNQVQKIKGKEWGNYWLSLI
jgi:hypothetical protein